MKINLKWSIIYLLLFNFLFILVSLGFMIFYTENFLSATPNYIILGLFAKSLYSLLVCLVLTIDVKFINSKLSFAASSILITAIIGFSHYSINFKNRTELFLWTYGFILILMICLNPIRKKSLVDDNKKSTFWLIFYIVSFCISLHILQLLVLLIPETKSIRSVLSFFTHNYFVLHLNAIQSVIYHSLSATVIIIIHYLLQRSSFSHLSCAFVISILHVSDNYHIEYLKYASQFWVYVIHISVIFILVYAILKLLSPVQMMAKNQKVTIERFGMYLLLFTIGIISFSLWYYLEYLPLLPYEKRMWQLKARYVLGLNESGSLEYWQSMSYCLNYMIMIERALEMYEIDYPPINGKPSICPNNSPVKEMDLNLVNSGYYSNHPRCVGDYYIVRNQENKLEVFCTYHGKKGVLEKCMKQKNKANKKK